MPPLTPAAQRCLQAAAELALRRGAAEVLPSHLLAALVRDESHAAELLEKLGWTGTAEQGPVASSSDDATCPDGPRAASLAAGRRVEQIVEAAGDSAMRCGAGETGSEHLLSGLIDIDSDASQQLADAGINAETLRRLLPDRSPRFGEPIPVNFSLGADNRRTYDNPEIPRPDQGGTDSGLQPQTGNLTRSEMRLSLRIVDAAANRSREGLRVLEDHARFALDSTWLTARLKSARHALAAAVNQCGVVELLEARDTVGDVGTAITTDQERIRTTSSDLVAANAKRVQEALRTLEEYGKLITPDAAATFERLRYAMYTIERELTLHPSPHGRPEDGTRSVAATLGAATLYLLVTEHLCRHGLEPTVREAVAGGVQVVQLREKNRPDREVVALGRKVRDWTRETGALFIMNDRPDLAAVTEADGVHVGQDELTVAECRRILGPHKLVGVSTHDIGQARRAVIVGADYLGVGPVFASQTKSFEQFAGLDYVRAAAGEIEIPWFAIGGVNGDNLKQVIAAGATHIAVSGAVCGADDASRAAVDLIRQLKLTR